MKFNSGNCNSDKYKVWGGLFLCLFVFNWRVVKYWNRFSRKAVQSLSLGVFQDLTGDHPEQSDLIRSALSRWLD